MGYGVTYERYDLSRNIPPRLFRGVQCSWQLFTLYPCTDIFLFRRVQCSRQLFTLYPLYGHLFLSVFNICLQTLKTPGMLTQGIFLQDIISKHQCLFVEIIYLAGYYALADTAAQVGNYLLGQSTYTRITLTIQSIDN